jgi:hypothetical protein
VPDSPPVLSPELKQVIARDIIRIESWPMVHLAISESPTWNPRLGPADAIGQLCKVNPLITVTPTDARAGVARWGRLDAEVDEAWHGQEHGIANVGICILPVV